MATIVGSLMIGVGCIEIFYPSIMAKWDRMVGRVPSTPRVYKLLGSILFVSGAVIVVFFNYLGPPKQ